MSFAYLNMAQSKMYRVSGKTSTIEYKVIYLLKTKVSIMISNSKYNTNCYLLDRTIITLLFELKISTECYGLSLCKIPFDLLYNFK